MEHINKELNETWKNILIMLLAAFIAVGKILGFCLTKKLLINETIECFIEHFTKRRTVYVNRKSFFPYHISRSYSSTIKTSQGFNEMLSPFFKTLLLSKSVPLSKE